LCILTFIGSGSSALANNIMFFTIEDWKLAYENGLFDNLGKLFEDEALQILMNVNPGFYLLQSVIYLLSLIGAILMWNLRKTGFHVYTVAQILLLISYNLFLSSQPFPFIPLLLSVTFILLYAKNLSLMH
jgi:hypothetical protein